MTSTWNWTTRNRHPSPKWQALYMKHYAISHFTWDSIYHVVIPVLKCANRRAWSVISSTFQIGAVYLLQPAPFVFIWNDGSPLLHKTAADEIYWNLKKDHGGEWRRPSRIYNVRCNTTNLRIMYHICWFFKGMPINITSFLMSHTLGQRYNNANLHIK